MLLNLIEKKRNFQHISLHRQKRNSISKRQRRNLPLIHSVIKDFISQEERVQQNNKNELIIPPCLFEVEPPFLNELPHYEKMKLDQKSLLENSTNLLITNFD